MEWEEISRRLKNGTSVQILADLDGVPYKTMYNRIKYHERTSGKQLIPDDDKKISKKKKKIVEEIKEAAKKVEPVVLIDPEMNLPFSHGIEITNETSETLGNLIDGLKKKLEAELDTVASLRAQLDDIQRILAFCRKKEAET